MHLCIFTLLQANECLFSLLLSSCFAYQELECVLLKKQNLERENQSLKSRLQESELALVAAKEDSDSSKKCSEDLEHRLLRSQNEARTSHSRMDAFMKEVEVLLGAQPATGLPKEEHILEKLREVCRREKSSSAVLLTPQLLLFPVVYAVYCWYINTSALTVFISLVNHGVKLSGEGYEGPI